MTKSDAKFTSDIMTYRSSRYSHARLTNIRYNNSILNVKVPHLVKYAKTRTWSPTVSDNTPQTDCL